MSYTGISCVIRDDRAPREDIHVRTEINRLHPPPANPRARQTDANAQSHLGHIVLRPSGAVPPQPSLPHAMKDGQPPADPGSSARARIRQQSAAVLAIGVREGLDGGVGVRVPVDVEARVQLDLVEHVPGCGQPQNERRGHRRAAAP